jgi:hypothetical protein
LSAGYTQAKVGILLANDLPSYLLRVLYLTLSKGVPCVYFDSRQTFFDKNKKNKKASTGAALRQPSLHWPHPRPPSRRHHQTTDSRLRSQDLITSGCATVEGAKGAAGAREEVSPPRLEEKAARRGWRPHRLEEEAPTLHLEEVVVPPSTVVARFEKDKRTLPSSSDLRRREHADTLDLLLAAVATRRPAASPHWSGERRA